jgi:hypothetical protein
MPKAAKFYRHVAPNGETMCCPDPETPEGWMTHEIPRLPEAHEEWDGKGKKWVQNKTKADKEAKLKKVRNLEALMDLIEDLQRRVEALEKK